MQIQINTDKNIKGNEELIIYFREEIIETLNRFSNNITRVEVHLSDENSDKKSKEKDKRCMIEARLEGRQPIVVTDNAETLKEALEGAINKLINMIDSIHGRQHDQKRHKVEQSIPDINIPDEK